MFAIVQFPFEKSAFTSHVPDLMTANVVSSLVMRFGIAYTAVLLSNTLSVWSAHMLCNTALHAASLGAL